MSNELSYACFEDECHDCNWGGCGCACHEYQLWEFDGGWVDVPVSEEVP